MPSDTLAKIREKYPQLNSVPDNILTVELGNKYPEWLSGSNDEQFKKEYNDYTSTTLGGIASQFGYGLERVPDSLMRTVSGTVEALSEDREGLGDQSSLYDYLGAGIGSEMIGNAIRDFFGIDDISSGINEAAKEYTDYLDEQLRRRREGGLIDKWFQAEPEYTPGSQSEMPTGVESFLGGDIADALGSLVPQIASGNLPGAMLTGGLQVFGNTYADASRAYEEDGDPNAKTKALSIALGDGFKTAVITKFGSLLTKKWGGVDADNLLKELATQGPVRAGLRGYLKAVFPSMTAEGIEEYIDEGLSAAGAKLTYNPEMTWQDVTDTALRAGLAGTLIGKGSATLKYGADYVRANRLARDLKAAGSPQAAEKVLKKSTDEIKKDAELRRREQQATDKSTYLFDGFDEDGNPIPAAVAVEGGQTTEDKDAETLRLEQESIPSPMTVSSVDASEEDLDVAQQQQQLIETPELTNDEIDELAQAQAIDDLGLVPIRPTDPKLAEQIPNFDTAQKDVYEETYKFYKDAYKQYQDKPNAWLEATGRQPEPTPEPEPVATPVATEQAPEQTTEAEEKPFSADPIERKKLLNRLGELQGKWDAMKKAGEFRWFSGAGKKANASNPAKRTAYPQKQTGLQGRKVVAFKRLVRKYAKQHGYDETELLNNLKQTQYEITGNKKRRNQKDPKRVQRENAAAAERIARSNNETEGSDVVDVHVDNIGKIPVPVDKNGKIVKPNDSSWDGSENYIESVREYFRRFPAAAEKTYEKVPVESPGRIDENLDTLKSVGALGPDAGTSDYWDAVTGATDKRVERIGKGDTSGEQESAEAEFAQQAIEEEADNLDDTPQADTEIVNSEETDGPFGAELPPSIVNGVRLQAPTSQEEAAFLSRLRQVLPQVQRRLGGAKVKKIVLDYLDAAPASSGARNGDFGTVTLNPRLIELIEQAGEGKIENYLSEEIIHNYGGLAIYNEWNSTGRPGTFRDYYETYYRGVYSEMSEADIEETILYYQNPEVNAARSEAFSSDPVAVAEEYIRIVTQREMTSDFTERLYKYRNNPGSFISRLLRTLSRFWNGLTRGFVPNAPRTRTLKRRLREVMGDQDTQFPPIDLARFRDAAAASQGRFDLGPTSPITEAEKQARKESTPKPETLLSSNQGGFLDGLFNFAELENKTANKRKAEDVDSEELEQLRREAGEGDMIKRMYYLGKLETLQYINEMKGQEATTITMDDTFWMIQPSNTDIILSDVIIEELYEAAADAAEKSPAFSTFDDRMRENARWYIFSRLANNARRYIKKYRVGNEDVTKVYLTKGVRGRPDFAKERAVRNYTRSFATRITRLNERVTESSRGEASFDQPVESESGSRVPLAEITKGELSDSLEADPRRDIVYTEVGAAIAKAYQSLTDAQRALLEFGLEKDFKYGWQNQYTKILRERGQKTVSRSNVSQLWDKVQANIISTLASSKLKEFDEQRMADAAKRLPPELRDGVLKIVGRYQEATGGKEPERTSPEEEAKNKERDQRALEDTPLFGSAGGFNITRASMPPHFVNHIIGKAKESARQKASMGQEPKKNSGKVKHNDKRSKATKEAMDAAESRKKTMLGKAKEKVAEIKEDVVGLTRQYKFLNPKKYPLIVNTLRKFEAVPQYSYETAQDTLRVIIGDMTPEQLKLFRLVLITRDLQRSVQEGLYDNKALPFKYSSTAELKEVYDQLEADLLLEDNAAVREALDRRAIVIDELVSDMKKRKLLPQNVADGTEYYHRVVLKHIEDKQLGQNAKGAEVRQRKAGFQQKRKGTSDDYSTNYFESEEEVLVESLAMIHTHDTLAELKEVVDVKPKLKRQANSANEVALLESGVSIEEFYKPQNRAMSIALSNLKKGIKKNTIKYHHRFNDVAASIGNTRTPHPDFFGFLKHLMDQGGDGAKYAGMIFKALKEKESKTKAELGDEYKTWRDLAKESKELTVWQPDRGNLFYRGTTASDNTLLQWYAKATDGETTVVTKDQFGNALILGGRKEEWVIPNEVASQFNEMKPEKLNKFFGEYAKWMSKWKYWKLNNPLSNIRYNINNLTGDLDVVFAYNRKILTYLPQTMRDLWNYHYKGEPMTPDMEMMRRQGVIGSGQILQDVGEFNIEQVYGSLFENDLSTDGKKKYNPIALWKALNRHIVKFGQFRENVLRASAYRFFIDELKAGKRPLGASNAVEIDEQPTDADKAGKLSRELLGDYGGLSSGGQILRRYAIPFWSWMEINAPRYVRMMRNAATDAEGGSFAGTVARKGAGTLARGGLKLGTFALAANTLPLFINLWNSTMVELGLVDEDDEDVIEARNQQHLLLYSNDEGRVVSIRFQGALTDFLDWVGLGSIHSDVKNVIEGDSNVGDVADKWITKDWYSGSQKIVSGLAPTIKIPLEMAAGGSFYPDWTKPRPIRDIPQYLLDQIDFNVGTAILSAGYDAAMDMPGRGMAQMAANLITYTTDTGEAAYQYIKSKEYEFLGEREPDRGKWSGNDKSDALYFWNKARMYGDTASAQAWMKRYEAAGGTPEGVARSLKGRAPLQVVRKYQDEFVESLSDTEKEMLKKANRWWYDSFK
jgi:hypothetical protein